MGSKRCDPSRSMNEIYWSGLRAAKAMKSESVCRTREPALILRRKKKFLTLFILLSPADLEWAWPSAGPLLKLMGVAYGLCATKVQVRRFVLPCGRESRMGLGL